MTGILTVTLNPAVDITTAIAELRPGEKLRCEEPRTDPGGGGVNVSRMIRELGGTSTALIAAGGPTGALLRELVAAAGLDAVFLTSAGRTRESLAVHVRTTGEQYRFVMPGARQDSAFAAQACATLAALLREQSFQFVVASGSLPPGLPEDFYGRMAGITAEHGARFVLDTSGPSLTAALGRGVHLVRANLMEGREVAAALGEDGEAPEAVAQAMLRAGGAKAVVLALGAEGALLASRDGCTRIRAPQVEVVSRVGAGDSFVGALAFALAEGWPLERACAFGVAAAAAAVTTPATELAHRADVERFFAGMDAPEPLP